MAPVNAEVIEQLPETRILIAERYFSALTTGSPTVFRHSVHEVAEMKIFDDCSAYETGTLVVVVVVAVVSVFVFGVLFVVLVVVPAGAPVARARTPVEIDWMTVFARWSGDGNWNFRYVCQLCRQVRTE